MSIYLYSTVLKLSDGTNAQPSLASSFQALVAFQYGGEGGGGDACAVRPTTSSAKNKRRKPAMIKDRKGYRALPHMLVPAGREVWEGEVNAQGAGKTASAW